MTDEELLARMEALLDRLKAAGAAGNRDSILITGRAMLELVLREGGEMLDAASVPGLLQWEKLLSAALDDINQQIGKLQ